MNALSLRSDVISSINIFFRAQPPGSQHLVRRKSPNSAPMSLRMAHRRVQFTSVFLSSRQSVQNLSRERQEETHHFTNEIASVDVLYTLKRDGSRDVYIYLYTGTLTRDGSAVGAEFVETEAGGDPPLHGQDR